MTQPAAPDLAALAVSGRVITPSDAEYDNARQVFNAAVDRRPAAIIEAADAADVSRAIALARENDLPLTVRGGAHSFAGHAVNDGGVVIDMSRMKGLAIDTAGRTAWAEAGLTAGQYSAVVGRHGLATGFGDAPSVGIAGITLGGGVGWLLRKHGLTIDSLLAVELVNAGGELIEVDADSHPDLFWALRGGGGNFGVVTRLRYRLHEVGTVLGGMLVLPASPAIVRDFLAAADAAPDELSTIAHLGPAPPLPSIPAEHHGRLALSVYLVYAGDVEAGERALAPIRALATPLADAVRPMSYPEIYDLAEGGPDRATVAVRCAFVDDIDDARLEAIFDRLQNATPAIAVTQLRVLGGAMANVASDATAFAHRDARLMLTVAAMAASPADAPQLEAWVDETASSLGLQGSAAYVNYLGGDSDARARDAYPAETYERLVEVKRRYDRSNLFRGHHDIALS